MNTSHPAPHPIRLFARGQAHLFVAVGKSDGTLSTLERVRAGYLAQKSQKNLDFFDSGEQLGQLIAEHIEQVAHDPAFVIWSAQQHLDQGISDIEQARSQGMTDTEALGTRIAAELGELAYLDGYTMTESLFVKNVLQRLNNLNR